MPRALWLVLAAGVAVWAAAFLQVEQRAAPAPDPEPEPEVALPAPPPPVAAVPARAPEPTAAPEPAGPPPPPVAAPSALHPTAPRGMFATATATWRAARDAFVAGPKPPEPAPAPDQVATGELGEGTFSPQYLALERAYTHEPRDGAWAQEQERLLRFSMRTSPLTQHLALVNCQQTICRMVFERAESDAFKQLVQTPELAQVTGLSAASPFSYRSGQLSVYFPRRSAIVEGAK